MDVKGKILLQLFNKCKFKNGTKTFLEPKLFLLIVKFKKLGFSAPLTMLPSKELCSNLSVDKTLFRREVSKRLPSCWSGLN